MKLICFIFGHRWWLDFTYRDGETEEEEDIMIEKVQYKCSICRSKRECLT